jgi:serine/threonine protein kinase/formylglycine-generating enzyme required for sulfatase activity
MAETDAILAEHPTLGPYTLTKKLGEGGMGGVYLGKHNVLQVEHAIKIIRPRMASDPQLVERFLREARHAARLIHPNIVQVLAADVADGLYYLAMQYVQGQSLAEAVAKGKLTPHRAVRYIHMACLGLHYAHRKQIIHRDIKPGNLLIDDEDNIKITDFGLVRDMAADDTGQNNLTQTGLIIGTPHFMPPEQWHGEGVDHRSDIYAMGVTLYHLMTRSYPYPGRTPPQILGLLMQGKPEPLKKFVPNIDDDLQAIVLKSMATDMAARYQSAAEMAADLDKWWQAHPATEAEQIALASGGTEGTKLATPTQLKSGGTLWSSTSARTGIPGTPESGGQPALSKGDGPPSTIPPAVSQATGPGATPTGIPTPSSIPQQVTIIQQGSKGGLVVGLTLVALIALALGAYAVFGNKQGQGNSSIGDGGSNPPNTALKVELKIDANDATEARPLLTELTSYVIDGTANLPVTLNEKPYKLGDAVALTKGENVLKLRAAQDGYTFDRTLVIFSDADSPELSVKKWDEALNSIIKGEVPTKERSVTISGKVSDTDKKVSVTASVNDKAVPDFPIDDKGNFEFNVPVDETDVRVEIRALDRLNHKSKPIEFVIVPDREESTVSWFGRNDGDVIWSVTKNVTISGKLERPKGRKLMFGKEEIKIAADGKFSVSTTLEEGAHTLKLELKDWMGRTSGVQAQVLVDLEKPKFSDVIPKSGVAFSFETFPAEIMISGKIDDITARLSINSESVKPDTKCAFSYVLKVDKPQKLSVKLIAKDMADRPSELTLEITVKLLRYRPLTKNPQGQMEYERLKDKMVFVAIPAGKFKQGVKDGLADAPGREVNMSTYLIAKFETTNTQFADFLNETAYNDTTVFTRDILSKDPQGGSWNLKYDGAKWTSDVGTQPVIGVTYNGARAYCRWADETSDLPSEAQWEYAARGLDERMYPWGNGTPSIARCNFAEGGLGGLAPVGKLKDGASPFGVMDAAGNVEEWCLDWYDVASYTKMMMDNPVVSEKPQGGERRVVRGGSYLSSATSAAKSTSEDAHSDLRAYQRGRALPQSGANDRGFRAAAKMPE